MAVAVPYGPRQIIHVFLSVRQHRLPTSTNAISVVGLFLQENPRVRQLRRLFYRRTRLRQLSLPPHPFQRQLSMWGCNTSLRGRSCRLFVEFNPDVCMGSILKVSRRFAGRMVPSELVGAWCCRYDCHRRCYDSEFGLRSHHHVSSYRGYAASSFS